MNASGVFPSTRWSQVCAAQGASQQAGAALAELCTAYYAPVHAYVRHVAGDLGDPRDLTHEFFARVLANKVLTGADRGKGRFRAYLLGAVKHFLSDIRDHQRAAKRGAQYEHIALLVSTDNSAGFDCASALSAVTDAWFDRQWGLAVLDRAVSALASEHEVQGRAEQFAALKPWLTGDADSETQSTAAKRLGMSDGAVKVAIHRLRKRFRDLLKAEISQTVSSEDEVRAELRYLVEVVTANTA